MKTHESRLTATREDQQTCFADLISIDALIALSELAKA